MMLSVGVIYGVLGCLVLCETSAQYSGFDSYYNQDEYYKQYPQYTQAQANSYHGYTTPQAINSNGNSVQVIEVSIPDIPMLNGGKHTLSKSEGSLITGVINKLLSQSGSSIPYTLSVHTYSDKKTPYVNSQSPYGVHSSSNFNQPNYHQQQQYPFNQQSYEQNLKQQQYQSELEQYEQKLREYYAKYPMAVPQQTTTSLPMIKVTESVKPNEIKPITHVPIVDDGKSLAELLLANQDVQNEPQPIGQSLGDVLLNQNKEPSDGKSLVDLINESKGQEEGGKSLAELLGHQSPSSTETPKKSLDDLIGNVFTEKQHKPTEPPSDAGGKSLFELLAELPPEQEISKELLPPKESPKEASHIDETAQQGKKNSDVAGGDYDLDVRTDDSKPKRAKRHILQDGFRLITDRISNFANNRRHESDHECNHNEGRNYHSHHGHRHNYDDENDVFLEHHKHNGWNKDKIPNHEYGNEPNFSHQQGHHMNGYGHEHHSRTHHNYDDERDKESKPHHNKKPQPFHEEKSFNQGDQSDEILQPSNKPVSADMGTQTDLFDLAKSASTKDPTLDIDVRGGFQETRRKRHNLKRTRRSPEEGIVFQDEDEIKAKAEAGKVESTTKVEEKASNGETTNTTETNGEGDEKGELDSRFGFFGGGGGFHRQAPGRGPIGSFIGGVLGGIAGGLNGPNQVYDPYYRPPGPSYPQYQGNGVHPPDYAQQQQNGYGNYPAPPPQQPIHIHINNVANAQSQATNTASGPHGIGSNQNAAANAQSENYENEFGAFQNAGASGQASNLAQDGASGQLSAANAMNQNYQNEFGVGSKNNAQSQAANFDTNGNLALTSSNSGTNHFAGPDGVRDETNSAAQSSLQGQFGTQNSGAQSNTYQGPHGSGSSASSQASSMNTGHGFQNSGSNAAANTGNHDGNSFGNAQSQTYANDQWGW